MRTALGSYRATKASTSPRLKASRKRAWISDGGRSGMALIVRRDAYSRRGIIARGNTRRHGNFLVLVLKLVELPIDTAIGQQLLVRTDFAHLAFVHHDDLAGAL